MLLIYTSGARTRRGGSCLRDLYRTCVRRAPARPVHACFVRSCCADVVQVSWPARDPGQSNAKRALSTHFRVRASHPALRTSHLRFTLDTSFHLKSCELSSSHFIPFLLTGHLSKFFSTVFISSEQSHLPEVRLNSSQLFCTPESSYYQREVSCTKKLLGAESFCTQTLGTQMHLHRKAFPKYFVLYKARTKLRNQLTNHYRRLDAATPIRFTMSCCKRQ